MTRRRARLVPAVLVALAVGAGTAGVTTLVAAPAVQDGTPDPVALNLTRTTVTSPPSPQPPTTSATTTTKVPPTTTTTTSKPKPTTTTSTPKPTTTTAKPAPKPPSGDGSADDAVLAIVNAERGQAGCAPVTLDARLTEAGQKHSEDMSANDYFSHTSQDGRSFVDRAKAEGYASPGAENIAAGQRSPEQVMQAWMNSSGHRANILNCDLKKMGLGLATEGYYWTQVFGY
ncbi:CAP domain-containing protein [Actinokineospora guangxiensis]|uniref:CAP domain-containing protein n=1 Tax=Actinokineospora guangxiensis TaxID=1490288 RepID=A0ABW0EWL7_9PSEU